MDVREREAFQLPQSGNACCVRESTRFALAPAQPDFPRSPFPPPPPQSFRDPARLEPWFCFDAVGRTRPDACLPGGVFGFWPLMPAAVFDFLTCRGGGGVSVFFLFFFSSLLFSPPAWRGLARGVAFSSPFPPSTSSSSPPPCSSHARSNQRPRSWLHPSCSDSPDSPAVERTKLRSSAPILRPTFPPLPLVPPPASCRLRPRPPPPPPPATGPSFLIRFPPPPVKFPKLPNLEPPDPDPDPDPDPEPRRRQRISSSSI